VRVERSERRLKLSVVGDRSRCRWWFGWRRKRKGFACGSVDARRSDLFEEEGGEEGSERASEVEVSSKQRNEGSREETPMLTKERRSPR